MPPLSGAGMLSNPARYYTLLGFGLDPPVQFTSCISFAHLNSPQINLINKPRVRARMLV